MCRHVTPSVGMSRHLSSNVSQRPVTPRNGRRFAETDETAETSSRAQRIDGQSRTPDEARDVTAT